jgi:uncharacterized protein (TIGR03089 family)
MLVADLLRARVHRAGAEPLITYYHVPRGERIELSGTTFGTWVAKVANLLSWEIGVAPGDAVGMPLARTDPGHWMTAVWQVATWQIGACVDLDPVDPAAVVCGPDWPAQIEGGYAGPGTELLACSLHPFATGLGSDLPPSVIDVDLAARTQPDNYVAAPVAPVAPAWADRNRRLSQADLVAGSAPAMRRLLVPDDPWATARDGILASLLGGGSTVVVVGGSAADLSRIGASELVDGR